MSETLAPTWPPTPRVRRCPNCGRPIGGAVCARCDGDEK